MSELCTLQRVTIFWCKLWDTRKLFMYGFDGFRLCECLVVVNNVQLSYV